MMRFRFTHTSPLSSSRSKPLFSRVLNSRILHVTSSSTTSTSLNFALMLKNSMCGICTPYAKIFFLWSGRSMR